MLQGFQNLDEGFRRIRISKLTKQETRSISDLTNLVLNPESTESAFSQILRYDYPLSFVSETAE